MNHEALGTSDAALRSAAGGNAGWETSNIQHSTPNIEFGEEACPTFDAVKASQARSDFIKATIIFFGLDGDCPSHSGKVTA
jgi:hypothetical protein